MSPEVQDYGEPFWVYHDPKALDHDTVWILSGPEDQENPDVCNMAEASLHDDVELAERFAACTNALKGCPDPQAFVDAIKKGVGYGKLGDFPNITEAKLTLNLDHIAFAWLREEITK